MAAITAETLHPLHAQVQGHPTTGVWNVKKSIHCKTHIIIIIIDISERRRNSSMPRSW